MNDHDKTNQQLITELPQLRHEIDSLQAAAKKRAAKLVSANNDLEQFAFKEEQTILLIEDNPGDSRFIEEMLKEITSFNYKLIIAETLKDGCKQIKKYKFILILLDLNLRDSTGKQTFDTVIKFSEKIPVVLVSGLNDVELSISLIKQGAQDYILKQDLNSNLLGKTIQYALIRKKAEEELKASEKHAHESDRLKSAFLANMSHEIRTPMNGILGFAELLKEPGLTGERQQEYIRIIEKSGARMLNIINDIVDISKIETGFVTANLRDVNINGKIEFVYKFFKPEIEGKGIQLFFKNGLPNENAILHTDEEKLYAILINLVKNAAKYTDSGLIEIGYKLVNKDILMPLIEFYVKDSGIGIPKDRQNAIFERFIQADISDSKAYQGAGLGLSISKAYVEMLGGTIWVKSEIDKGSTFYFTIPYYTGSNMEIVENQGLPGKVEKKHENNLCMLIVDDDDVSRSFLELITKRYSKNTLFAKNGREAVELVRNTVDLDLILMDIKMPVMNGYEATQQIRQFNKDVTIIGQSAYALDGDREKSLEAGCNDYITKPIGTVQLHDLIHKHFREQTPC